MKTREFAELMDAYEQFLGSTDPRTRDVRAIAAAFREGASAAVSAALKKRQGASLYKPPTSQDRDVAACLNKLGRLVAPVTKSTVVNDVEAVAEFIDRYSVAALTMPLPAPVKRSAGSKRAAPVDEAFVSDSVSELSQTLGDPNRFPVVYGRVTERAGAKEIVAIAKLFTPGSAKSAAEAKKRIWNRHEALLGVAAKGRATEGRSAA